MNLQNQEKKSPCFSLPPHSNLYLPLLLTHSGKDHVGRERKENIYMATFSELYSQEKFALQASVTGKLQLIFKGACHLTGYIILVPSEESFCKYLWKHKIL